MEGLDSVIEMILDGTDAIRIAAQFQQFWNGTGLFGHPAALGTAHTLLAWQWWSGVSQDSRIPIPILFPTIPQEYMNQVDSHIPWESYYPMRTMP